MLCILKQTIVTFKQLFLTNLTTVGYTRYPHPVTKTKKDKSLVRNDRSCTRPKTTKRQRKLAKNRRIPRVFVPDGHEDPEEW